MKKLIFMTLCVTSSFHLNAQQNWSSAGNASINPATEFLGTTDNVPLLIRVNNIAAGSVASNGYVSFGYQSNIGTTHYSNTAFGHQTLMSLTTTSANWSTAIGYQAGASATTGSNLTFIGYRAGFGSTTGTSNTGIGAYSLGSEVSPYLTGDRNSALGFVSLRYVTSGSRNLGFGYAAGIGDGGTDKYSKIDNDCIFIGSYASRDASVSNTTALNNAIAIGSYARVGASNSLILGGTGSYALNVGIGNIAPGNKLEITYGTSGNSGLRFTNLTSSSTAGTSSGKVLSVNSNGDVVLEAAGSGSTPDGSETIVHAGTGISVGGIGTIASPYVITYTGTSYWSASGIGSNNIVNSNTGAVVIGSSITTLPSGYKLYVQDGILAEKVKVALKSGSQWADYVFSGNYTLTPLTEVESFIKTNKHLPGMPSAETLVKEGGIDVNQMFAKQMEKIEELTLYIIEMNKKLEKLEKENSTLKSSIVNQ